MAARSLSRTQPSSVAVTTVVTSVLTVQTTGRGFVDLSAEVTSGQFSTDEPSTPR